MVVKVYPRIAASFQQLPWRDQKARINLPDTDAQEALMKITSSSNRYVRVTPVAMATTAAILGLSLLTFNANAELSIEESGALQQALVSEDDPNVGWRLE